jgi:hypothetical protein
MFELSHSGDPTSPYVIELSWFASVTSENSTTSLLTTLYYSPKVEVGRTSCEQLATF